MVSMPVSNQADYNHFYRTEESQLLIHKITSYRIKTDSAILQAITLLRMKAKTQ